MSAPRRVPWLRGGALMPKYRLPSVRQKAAMLKVIRFPFECVEACSFGTENARDYERHLTTCGFIFPAVAVEISKRLARGEVVAVEPRPKLAEDRPGQMELIADAPRTRKAPKKK